MFEINESNQVLKSIEVTTPTQTAIIQEPIGMKNRVVLTTDKTTASLNEVVSITAKWLVFDLNSGTYIDNPSNTTEFLIDADGNKGSVTNSFTFSSEEPGEYMIRTENSGADNDFIKVVIG